MTKQRRTRPGEALRFLQEHLARPLESFDDECVLWPYSRGGGHSLVGDYGKLVIGGRKVYWHRAVCQAFHGMSDLQAAHSCGVPLCGNPRHIRWCTNRENSHDRRIHGTAGRKLTVEDVRAIKAELHAGERTHAEIAEQYPVGTSMIGNISSGLGWAWVD